MQSKRTNCSFNYSADLKFQAVQLYLKGNNLVLLFVNNEDFKPFMFG